MKRAFQRIVSSLLALLLLAGMTQLPALADGVSIVGEVTVITTTSVNLRSGGSTDYPVVASAQSGQLFQTTGQVSTGWFEIILPTGGYAYISDKLVYFYPYSVPVPLGSQYTVPVYYRTAQGVTLKTVNVPVKLGQNIVSADDSQVPGYRLVSTRSVYVSVDSVGRVTPSGVFFTYEPYYGTPTAAPEMTATIPVYYKDIYNRVIATEYRTLKPGSHLLRSDATKLPAGWYISGASDAVIFVNSLGTASPSEVSFVVSQGYSQPQQPAVFSVPVSYRDEQGTVLYTTSQSIQPGYTTVTANDALVPAGYTLSSVRSVVVYASSQGYAIPSTVVFTYKRAVMATISIIYQDLSGRVLFYNSEQKGPGTYTVRASSTRVPAGYKIVGNGSAEVTVYANGVVSPSQVVFTYTLPINTNLPIIYRDTDGRQLYAETRSLTPGTHTITADDSLVPRQYILQNTRNVKVTANNDGTSSPERVVYIYEKPVSADITITYRNTSGVVVYQETRTLQQGTHTITANDSLAPSGSVLYSEGSVNVTVDGSGRASPSRVEFRYGPPRPPVSVNVPVYYKDQAGNILFYNSFTVSSDNPVTLTANDDRVPAGYVLMSDRRITVSVSPAGIPTPKEAVFLYRDPNISMPAGPLPRYQTFSYSGSSQAVYSGPGTNYYRSNGGRASVSGGRLRVWGTEGDWALIGYGLTNNLYRVGYIKKNTLPKSLSVAELQLGTDTVKVVKAASIYDDPIIQPIELFKLSVGTQVTLLGFYDDHWAYIEGRYGSKPFRGFVNKVNISKP